MKVKRVFTTIASIINIVVAMFFFALSVVMTLGFATEFLPQAVATVYDKFFEVLNQYTTYVQSFWVVLAVACYLPSVTLAVANVCLLKKKPALGFGTVMAFIGSAVALAVLYLTQVAWVIESIQYFDYIVLCAVAFQLFLYFICLFLPNKAKAPKVAVEKEQIVDEEQPQEVAVEQPQEVAFEQPQEVATQAQEVEQKEEVPSIQEELAKLQAEPVAPSQEAIANRGVRRSSAPAQRKGVDAPQQPKVDSIIQPTSKPQKEVPAKFEAQENMSVAQVVDSTYGSTPAYNGDRTRYLDDTTSKQLEKVKRLYELGAITENEYTALIMSFLSDKKN